MGNAARKTGTGKRRAAAEARRYPKMARGEKLKFSAPGSRRFVVLLVVLVILIIVGFNSYYTVEPQETAVIQRFGQYVATAEPGFHFKIPFGVDTVSKVVTGRILQREYGYRTVASLGSYDPNSQKRGAMRMNLSCSAGI